MLKKNEEIHYRPTLADKLANILELLITLYNVNFRYMYYDMMARALVANEDNQNEFTEPDFIEKYAESNQKYGELALFLSKVAICFKNEQYEFFEEEYKKEMVKKYKVKVISEVEAANSVFEMYIPIIEELKSKLLVEVEEPPLTKREKFLIDSFIQMATAPFRNPNIKIPDGYTQCWYDRHNTYDDFKKDLKESVEWIRKNTAYILEMFRIQE